MRTILVTVALISISTAALADMKGQDRSGSQCQRTNKDGTTASGSCGAVCKDLNITTATGEAQKSGYQYTCTEAAMRVRPPVSVQPGTRLHQ
jgi:hypothetical protein